MKDAPAGPIVCLGDSIAAAGWPAVLETRLREAGWTNVRCVNAGVRGNTSTQGLRRLEKDVLAHQPALVLVQFGFNDCNVVLNGPRPRTLKEDFRKNLIVIADRTEETGASVILIANHRTLMHRILPDGRPYEEHSQEYTAVVAQLAVEMEVPCIDMREEFPGPGILLADALDEDGIHLSPVGIACYAQIVAGFLLER
ncbi:MAG: GDSL-type esterase/lipase family protein [Armatimonadota bacterium]|nr:GDSL-type esterase/lipase family protein [Armatimonadota bacterium]